MDQVPQISEWFREKSVLITGGTGFLGKALISKLLLTCPDIENVYVLIREKKGIDTKSRLQVLLQQEPFRELRNHKPERLKKLKAISGDTSIDGLDLSEENKHLLIQDVSVVFHMAANVKFDLSLKDAVNMNTRGTVHVLDLAKQLPHLVSFIHVSTAYCQCGETVLEERSYPIAVSPEKVFAIIDTNDDETLKSLTPKLIGNQPNTYAFSKALSEDLISRCSLPVGVARPSIVSASWKEPTPGWVDNMNGATGLMIGAGKGVIRSMLCNPNYLTDIIPCDMAVNATIALAWKVGLAKPSKPIFMNVTESGENPISWGTALESGRRHALKYPFSGPLWYPGGGFTSSKVIHWVCILLFHLIPAYFLDGLFYLTGHKPFLVRLQGRIAVGLELLQYYTTKQWIFKNETMKELQQSLRGTDKGVFFMDTKAIDWDKYILDYILGTRKYCLKDDESTLPKARRVHSYLYVADLCVRVLFYGFLVYTIYSWTVPFKTQIGTLIQHDN